MKRQPTLLILLLIVTAMASGCASHESNARLHDARDAPPAQVAAIGNAPTTSLTGVPAGVPFVEYESGAVGSDLEDATPPASADATASELAKKTQNPVADLISVPFQSNFLQNVGHRRKSAYVLNIQPVIPIHLNEDWNVITRTILPVIDSPEIVPGFGDESGLGDIDFTAFLSPSKPEGWIFGFGPTVSLPTASEDELGSERWGFGPSAVALKIDGPWVYGALVKNQWDVGGDSDRKHINRGLMQPFVNYNLAGGWYLVSGPIITANWKADSGEKWTVPVGGGFGRLFLIGEQPVNAQFQTFYNVVHPSLGGNWSMRLQIQFLF